MLQERLPEPAAPSHHAPLGVAFLANERLSSVCFPDYFGVVGNVAGASALRVTPRRSQGISLLLLLTHPSPRQQKHAVAEEEVLIPL